MTQTSTATLAPSAIRNLLDKLIKHGTLPNMPVPDLIVNAQVELAALEFRIEALQGDIARLRDVEGIAKFIVENRGQFLDPAYRGGASAVLDKLEGLLDSKP